MVGRYSDTAKYAAHADRIAAIVSAADLLRQSALRLADADVDAFGAVGRAYRLPKDTTERIAVRSAAISSALVRAGRVPADVIRVADEILSLAEELEPIGNRNVVTDVAAAAEAARAAATTARVNVEINLGGIADREVVAELRSACRRRRRHRRTGRQGHRRRPERAHPMTQTMTGSAVAQRIRDEVSAAAADLTVTGIVPNLAVVLATADEATASYVRSIARTAQRCGVRCTVVDLGPDATPVRIRSELDALSDDPAVHGIILQSPLPPAADFDSLASAIDPAKDIDGANPLSLGLLAARRPAFAPATAEAVLVLLDHYAVPLAGANAVVIGRSTVVGKPAALLLIHRDATVSVCHRHTKDLAEHARRADVLVVAAGQPGLITAEHVGPATVVVDVGTNATADGALVGDVDAAAITGRAAALTPVPGGVGPVTTALLLQHTIASAGR
jgi:methylenetetrahydrofolate dehydrogenase (NADP+)/methenyltetrahydrofolate cyclohydrolase